MLEAQRTEASRVFIDVAEKQAFLFADPMSGEEFRAPEGGFLAGSMTFKGPARGGVMLAVPEKLALEIAANVLGADADDPEAAEAREDSLGEILNVTCGHLLTALFGAEAVFDLSVPRLFTLDGPEASVLARKGGSVCFSVDGDPVLMQVCFCDAEGNPDAEC